MKIQKEFRKPSIRSTIDAFTSPVAIVLATFHAVSAAILFANLMVPGTSLLLSLTAWERALLGSVCGGIGMPAFGAVASQAGPRCWSNRSAALWLMTALTLPGTLFILCQLGASQFLHWRYTGKGLLVCLFMATFCTIPEGREIWRRILERCRRSSIASGFLIYITGDTVLWLMTPEIQVKSTDPSSVLLNIVISGSLCQLLVSAMGGRKAGTFAFMVVGLAWYIAMYLKIRWMHTPLVPLDVQYFREFLMVAPDILGWPIILLIFGAISASVLMVIRLQRIDFRPSVRARIFYGSATAVIVGTLTWFAPSLRNGTEGWSPLWQWCLDGSGVSFLADLRKSVEPLSPPEGYSRSVAEEIVAMNRLQNRIYHMNSALTEKPGPNLVFLLVESLIDLRDIGVIAEPDPQLFLHSMRSQQGNHWAIVPEICGGSSTTEFELLTGMEARMWPARTVPYYALKWGEYESIPRLLKHDGYNTTVFHVDSPSMYNRPAAYSKLQIENVRWLSEEPLPSWVKRRPDGLAELFRIELDEVLFEAMAGQLESATQPAFIFGFTGGTHAPYDADPVPWRLDYSGEADPRELAGYCVEVRELDLMLEKLWQRIQATSGETLLVVVGDHMPPMKSRIGPLGGQDPDPLALRRVPLLVLGLQNVELPECISTNMLAWFLLDQLRSRPGSTAEILGRAAMHEQPVLSGNQVRKASAASAYRIFQFGHLNGDLPLDFSAPPPQTN